jgi:ribonuclease P protein component
MIPKENRLPVQDVRDRRPLKVQNTHFFSLKTFTRPAGGARTPNSPRFGVVVSKTVAKTAVSRNRLRRLFFRVVGANLNDLPVADHLVILRQSALQLSDTDFKAELLKLFRT